MLYASDWELRCLRVCFSCDVKPCRYWPVCRWSVNGFFSRTERFTIRAPRCRPAGLAASCRQTETAQ